MADEDHSNHGSGSGENSCPMQMSFHGGACEAILWSSWQANTVGKFVGSAFFIFFLAIAYEGLKHYREKLFNAHNQDLLIRCSTTCKDGQNLLPPKTLVQNLFNKHHIFQTLLHFIQVALSYLLMLIVMTFNYWLCLAVVLGACVGYFSFGWLRRHTLDPNEHCH